MHLQVDTEMVVYILARIVRFAISGEAFVLDWAKLWIQIW